MAIEFAAPIPYNAFGAAALGYNQRVPADSNVSNVINHRMAGDTTSNLSKHYGKVVTYGSPTKENGNHSISNFTYRGKNAHAKDQTYVLADPERWQNYKETHVVPTAAKGTRVGIAYGLNPVHLIDTALYKMRKPTPAGQRADKAGVPPYHTQGNALASLKVIKSTLTLSKRKPILVISAIFRWKFKNFLPSLNLFIIKSMKKCAIYVLPKAFIGTIK
ncbi:hypothetical protein [Kingella sp. (in: b-proteobacteria)]|uniref:hypothetical protein n=1 Tax=Kingella sp. (in: b-proteobacteria) TaxID=2020713 RepID=UPI0026DCA56D|nr:hypothetical protein [Kingella sp. (in: b-proteobacteria)]MDO4657806.1 hypothetical protein [Kingella sp. (in: b-proteobacteria)]